MLGTDTNKKPGTFTEELYIAYRLGIELDVACKEINALKEEVHVLTEEVQRLREQLGLAQAARFGKKSEASKENPVEAEVEAKPEGNIDVIHVKGYNRKKKNRGRLLDTSQLLRHKMYYDLAEADKVCASCKNGLKRIGEDVSEQVEVVPQQLYVVEHIRYKYACTACETVKMAEKPMSPIPKAMAGASLLTEIVIKKYQYHLPLYRQSKIYASYDMLIPDNTLGNWVMRLGGGLGYVGIGLGDGIDSNKIVRFSYFHLLI